MTNGQHNHDNDIKFNADDYSDVTHPVSPGAGKIGFERLPLCARIIKRRNSVCQKAQDTRAIARRKSLQVLLSAWFEADGPRRHRSAGPRSSA